ncbi:MAG: hypothetical protein LUF30_04760 [Lachnospiraceae bacterium]|nr:hypothetical protein [Lachnospiraceae bacterium]
MTKKQAFLIVMIFFILLSLSGISTFVADYNAKGWDGVNYGCFIPLLLLAWSFVQWKNSE